MAKKIIFNTERRLFKIGRLAVYWDFIKKTRSVVNMPRFKKGSPEAKKWAEDMRKKQAEKLAKTLTPPAQDPPKADPSKSDLGLGPGPGPGPDPAPGPQDPPKDKVSCSECSAENDADAKKCVNCGEDFDE